MFDALPGWITGVLDRFGPVDFDTIERRLVATLALGSQFIAKQALGIGQNTFEYVAGVFITLTAFGALVIGLVDNLLRPVQAGKDTRMPDYLVMITTLGGMAVFGLDGFVLGPAVAAMFIAAWHIQVTGDPARHEP